MGLAPDGSVQFGNANAPISGALTTVHAGDVIVAYLVANTTDLTNIGISDTAGLTWKLRKSFANTNPNALQSVWEYYAIASGALSADTITVTTPKATVWAEANVFGISGANTAAPFDANSSVPQIAAGGTSYGGTAKELVVSTDAANTMVLAFFVAAVNSAPGDYPSPWTTLLTGNYMAVGYQVFSSAQTNLSVPVPSDGINDAAELAADAIVAATGGGTSVQPYRRSKTYLAR